MLDYFRRFASKLAQKAKHPQAFHHISYAAIIGYTVGQAWAELTRTSPTRLLVSRHAVADGLTVLDTPYGPLYAPPDLSDDELGYILRESFDDRHWHHYCAHGTVIAPGDVVVDCGASMGCWLLPFRNAVGTVHFFEPQQAFCRCLEKTYRTELDRGKAHIHNHAAGDVNAVGKFVFAKEGDICGKIDFSEPGDVSVRTIDTVLDGQRVDYIKADIEGAEANMLRGAAETIRRWHPKIAITVYHDENDWEALLGFVKSLVPAYRHELVGIAAWGKPIMLHLRCD